MTHFIERATCHIVFQHWRDFQLASTASLFYSDFLTSAQLKILLFFLALLLAILGLSGAPIALPLQHVADHHPQQAEEEENGHEDESSVVLVTNCSTFTFSRRCRLTRWRMEGWRNSNYFKYCCNSAQEKQNNGFVITTPLTAT